MSNRSLLLSSERRDRRRRIVVRKQARITSKGQITVPQDIRHRLGVRPGDRLLFESDSRGVRIRPLRVNSSTLVRDGVCLADVMIAARDSKNSSLGLADPTGNRTCRIFQGRTVYSRQLALVRPQGFVVSLKGE